MYTDHFASLLLPKIISEMNPPRSLTRKDSGTVIVFLLITWTMSWLHGPLCVNCIHTEWCPGHDVKLHPHFHTRLHGWSGTALNLKTRLNWPVGLNWELSWARRIAENAFYGPTQLDLVYNIRIKLISSVWPQIELFDRDFTDTEVYTWTLKCPICRWKYSLMPVLMNPFADHNIALLFVDRYQRVRLERHVWSHLYEQRGQLLVYMSTWSRNIRGHALRRFVQK